MSSTTTKHADPPNLAQWNANAHYWDTTLADGNNMFRELILPTIEELAELKPGEKVLDLGTGNGIVARRLAGAQRGVEVLGTDYSEAQLERARIRTEAWVGEVDNEERDGWVTFERLDLLDLLDLLDSDGLGNFADKYSEEFDVITASTLLKELCDLKPLAMFLPKVLKPGGRVIFTNLHPCFHKPGAHRVVEVLENPDTAEQEIHTSIKVSKYLDIGPVQSQAMRGQPQPLVWFHRPIHQLLEPFFEVGLVMDRVREPAFSPNSGERESEGSEAVHAYRNFGQIPMQFIFRLVQLPGCGCTNWIY